MFETNFWTLTGNASVTKTKHNCLNSGLKSALLNWRCESRDFECCDRQIERIARQRFKLQVPIGTLAIQEISDGDSVVGAILVLAVLVILSLHGREVDEQPQTAKHRGSSGSLKLL